MTTKQVFQYTQVNWVRNAAKGELDGAGADDKRARVSS
jgi:hypothetical protein